MSNENVFSLQHLLTGSPDNFISDKYWKTISPASTSTAPSQISINIPNAVCNQLKKSRKRRYQMNNVDYDFTKRLFTNDATYLANKPINCTRIYSGKDEHSEIGLTNHENLSTFEYNTVQSNDNDTNTFEDRHLSLRTNDIDEQWKSVAAFMSESTERRTKNKSSASKKKKWKWRRWQARTAKYWSLPSVTEYFGDYMGPISWPARRMQAVSRKYYNRRNRSSTATRQSEQQTNVASTEDKESLQKVENEQAALQSTDTNVGSELEVHFIPSKEDEIVPENITENGSSNVAQTEEDTHFTVDDKEAINILNTDVDVLQVDTELSVPTVTEQKSVEDSQSDAAKEPEHDLITYPKSTLITTSFPVSLSSFMEPIEGIMGEESCPADIKARMRSAFNAAEEAYSTLRIAYAQLEGEVNVLRRFFVGSDRNE